MDYFVRFASNEDVDAKYLKFEQWRGAIFQDMQESHDGSKLYFLYDPLSDDRNQFCQPIEASNSILIFDMNIQYFVGEVELDRQKFPGKAKFLFKLMCSSENDESSMIVVTETNIAGKNQLHISKLEFSNDGLSITQSSPIIYEPLNLGEDYICTIHKDYPLLFVMTNPGFQMYTIDCTPEKCPTIAVGESLPCPSLENFYDAFPIGGYIYLLSSTSDDSFNPSIIHFINIYGTRKTMSMRYCSPDVLKGMPRIRKQCGMDSTLAGILLAGGEFENNYNTIQALTDSWLLDTTNFTWRQISETMPCHVIEPRISASQQNIFCWGDSPKPISRWMDPEYEIVIFRINDALDLLNNSTNQTSFDNQEKSIEIEKTKKKKKCVIQ